MDTTTVVVWRPSIRIIAARFPTIPYFEVAANADDAVRNLDLARLTDGTATGMRDAYRELPNEDRLSGPGSGLLMPSWLFPANPGRFSNGLRGGTYYAASDETTARAESMHHFAADVERSPAALRAALEARLPPRRAMQAIAADVLGVFLDLRGARTVAAVAPFYHLIDYAPGQQLEPDVRTRPIDGIVYDSVRRLADVGECVAVYRPRALRDARVASRFTYEWAGPGRVEYVA